MATMGASIAEAAVLVPSRPRLCSRPDPEVLSANNPSLDSKLRLNCALNDDDDEDADDATTLQDLDQATDALVRAIAAALFAADPDAKHRAWAQQRAKLAVDLGMTPKLLALRASDMCRLAADRVLRVLLERLDAAPHTPLLTSVAAAHADLFAALNEDDDAGVIGACAGAFLAACSRIYAKAVAALEPYADEDNAIPTTVGWYTWLDSSSRAVTQTLASFGVETVSVDDWIPLVARVAQLYMLVKSRRIDWTWEMPPTGLRYASPSMEVGAIVSADDLRASDTDLLVAWTLTPRIVAWRRQGIARIVSIATTFLGRIPARPTGAERFLVAAARVATIVRPRQQPSGKSENGSKPTRTTAVPPLKLPPSSPLVFRAPLTPEPRAASSSPAPSANPMTGSQSHASPVAASTLHQIDNTNVISLGSDDFQPKNDAIQETSASPYPLDCHCKLQSPSVSTSARPDSPFSVVSVESPDALQSPSLQDGTAVGLPAKSDD